MTKFDFLTRNLTTLNTGGRCSAFCNVEDEEHLGLLIKACLDNNIKYYVVGNGSNLLVSDDDLDGVIIKLGRGFKSIEINEDTVKAGAAYSLIKLSNSVSKKGLANAEFLCGIPGTVGGGISTNCGAFGWSVANIVRSVRIFKKSNMQIIERVDGLKFSYRKCDFLEEGDIVLSAEFGLKKDDQGAIAARMEEYSGKRMNSQPVFEKSAGCVFKNPALKKAWELIDEAGMRGKIEGGAMVSDKHSNFIINVNKAKSSDIYKLMRQIKAKVREKFDIELEAEIRLLGNFNGPEASNV